MPATPPPTTSAAPVDLGGEPDIRTPLRLRGGPRNEWGDHRLNGPLGCAKYSCAIVSASTRRRRAREGPGSTGAFGLARFAQIARDRALPRSGVRPSAAWIRARRWRRG